MAKPSGFSAGFAAGFGVGRYRYALAPYVWDTSDPESPFWRMPASSVGGIDLRPLAAQGIAGGAPQGFAFVAAMQPVAGVAVATSLHMADENASAAMQDAWEAGTGYRPSGAKLVDLLWDQLTVGADPAGDAGPKPLLPTVGGQLELWLPGHSLVKSESFVWGVHPHTNRVQAVLQRDFEAMWEETNGDDHCRRVLDYHCEKYRISDWKEFVPQRLRAHVPGRLPHATTITDDFNRADQTGLGTGAGGWSWTSVTGSIDIASNQATPPALVANRSRAESDLSSVDHYAQADIVALSGSSRVAGPMARYASAADTGYIFLITTGGATTLDKVVTGTRTALGTSTASISLPDTLKMESNGSTQTGYYNAVSNVSLTDTAITTGTRTGLHQRSGITSLDNFEAADLAGGASSSPSSSPSTSVSSSPSTSVSSSPSASPSTSVSASPSSSPSASASGTPSASPSTSPSPSASASASPSESPSTSPSASVSSTPSESPSTSPSTSPSASVSASPSGSPSASPSPSGSVSASPSTSPSGEAATITIEVNLFTQSAEGVNLDSTRLIQFELTNPDDVVLDFPESQVT